MKENKKYADELYEEYKKLQEETKQLRERMKILLSIKWESQEQVIQYRKLKEEFKEKEKSKNIYARLIVKHIYGEEEDEQSRKTIFLLSG